MLNDFYQYNNGIVKQIKSFNPSEHCNVAIPFEKNVYFELVISNGPTKDIEIIKLTKLNLQRKVLNFSIIDTVFYSSIKLDSHNYIHDYGFIKYDSIFYVVINNFTSGRIDTKTIRIYKLIDDKYKFIQTIIFENNILLPTLIIQDKNNKLILFNPNPGKCFILDQYNKYTLSAYMVGNSIYSYDVLDNSISHLQYSKTPDVITFSPIDENIFAVLMDDQIDIYKRINQ